MRRLPARVAERLVELEAHRQKELDQTLAELRDIAQQCRERIEQAG